MGTGKNGNLIPLGKRDPDEAREIRSKGGKACACAQRKRKELKETLLELLAMENNQEEICKKLLSGEFNAKTFEVIRDTIGEKPETSVENKITITQALVSFSDEVDNDGDEES